jgi:hypothetical protein
LPDNVDEVSSETEARLFTAALSDYTVTPHSLLAGIQEIISIPPFKGDMEDSDLDSRRGVLFYVSYQNLMLLVKNCLLGLTEIREYMIL